jgi:hypothetical protein
MQNGKKTICVCEAHASLNKVVRMAKHEEVALGQCPPMQVAPVKPFARSVLVLIAQVHLYFKDLFFVALILALLSQGRFHFGSGVSCRGAVEQSVCVFTNPAFSSDACLFVFGFFSPS